MPKLQEIENALLNINDAVFQNLCDSYLFYSEKDILEFHSIGSQKGKQKTKKGTPDTLITLPNGNYVFVEYTTKSKTDNKKVFLKKLEDDIKSCLDLNKTGIPLNKIERIILCFNSDLTAKELQNLKSTNGLGDIQLQVIGIDKLSKAIYSRYQFLAKEFLNISLDSGQILLKDKFIEEYQRVGLATPLDNKFFFREKELEEISTLLSSNNVIILTGSPGVGKSRLALAAVEKWKSLYKYELYCISSKGNVPIFDDIKTYFEIDKNYLIFIDDANRQTYNLNIILSLLKDSNRKGDIKFILTVRDYALGSILTECLDYNPIQLLINKLTEKQIKSIISSEDFNITNGLYIERINKLSNGNPRLAIMMAKIAIQEQNLLSLEDVSDVYEKYFQTFIKDNHIFTDKNILKILGLISFFYVIDKKNIQLYEFICQIFNVDKVLFDETLNVLEQLELIELSEDKEVAKIAEQVLATYFFYKVFLKDDILDFSLILNHFFDSHSERIKDSVIPANNSFGYKNVYDKTNIFLDNYWTQIKYDINKAFNFLHIFWFYRPENVFSFILDILKKSQKIKNPSFVYKKNSDRIRGMNNKYFNLLSNFYKYRHDLSHFTTSLGLASEYLLYFPEQFSVFVDNIKDNLGFSYDDYRVNYIHQEKLIEFILSGAKQYDERYLSMFYEIIPFLMKTDYTISGSSTHPYGISFYQSKVLLTEGIKKIRKEIWQFLIDNFNKYPEELLSVFQKYLERSPDHVNEIYEYDLPFIYELIDSHFQSTRLEHCFHVRDMISWFKRMGINDNRFEELKNKYYGKSYKYYSLLSWNRLRDKEDYEFESYDHDKYEKLKHTEIRNNLIFKDLNHFIDFYNIYLEILKFETHNLYAITSSFDLVLKINYENNNQLGLKIIKYIIDMRNEISHTPYSIFEALDKDEEYKWRELYNVIDQSEFSGKSKWIFNFYDGIPDVFLKKEDCVKYIEALNNCNDFHNLDLLIAKKLLLFDRDIFKKVLEIIYKKNKDNIQLLIWKMPDNYIENLDDELDLFKRVYILQKELNHHFDFGGEQFVQLIIADNSFLLDYVKYFAKNNKGGSRGEFYHLHKVWELDNSYSLIKNCILFLWSLDGGRVDDIIESFFQHSNGKKDKVKEPLLKEIITENMHNSHILHACFELIRDKMPNRFNDLLLHFLSINQEINDFKSIPLLASSFAGSAETIWAEERAKELNEYLKLIDTLPNQILYIKHKEYIKERIFYENRSAMEERKMKFMGHY